MMSSPSSDPVKEIFPETVLFLALVVGGILTLVYLRKKITKKTTKNSTYDSLMDMRQLRGSGQITKDEYEAALKNISRQIKNQTSSK